MFACGLASVRVSISQWPRKTFHVKRKCLYLNPLSTCKFTTFFWNDNTYYVKSLPFVLTYWLNNVNTYRSFYYVNTFYYPDLPKISRRFAARSCSLHFSFMLQQDARYNRPVLNGYLLRCSIAPPSRPVWGGIVLQFKILTLNKPKNHTNNLTPHVNTSVNKR